MKRTRVKKSGKVRLGPGPRGWTGKVYWPCAERELLETVATLRLVERDLALARGHIAGLKQGIEAANAQALRALDQLTDARRHTNLAVQRAALAVADSLEERAWAEALEAGPLGDDTWTPTARHLQAMVGSTYWSIKSLTLAAREIREAVT